MVYVFYGKNEGLVYYVEPPTSLGSDYIEVMSGDIPKKEGYETRISVNEDTLEPVFEFKEIVEPVDEKTGIEQLREDNELLSDTISEVMMMVLGGDE